MSALSSAGASSSVHYADMEVSCALATRFSDEDEDAAGAPSAAATAFASCVRSTYASYIRIHIEPAGRHCSEVLKEIEIEFPQVANSSMRSVGHLDHLLDLVSMRLDASQPMSQQLAGLRGRCSVPLGRCHKCNLIENVWIR